VTQMSARSSVSAGSACIAVLVLGCGCSVTAGQPTAETSTTTTTTTTVASPTASAPAGPRSAADVSPCDDLPAVNVAAVGFDPSTKRKADLRGQGVSERGCRWTGKDMLVDILSTDATVAMYKARRDLANVQVRTVAGLPSLSVQIPDDPGGCRVVSDVPGGGLVTDLSIKGEHEAAVGVDSCTAAVRVMEQVAPILLKAK